MRNFTFQKLLLSMGFVFLIQACTQRSYPKIEPCFYFWKSNFHLSLNEQQKLKTLNVKSIYTKYFDIIWHETTKQPMPVAKLQMDSAINYQIIPTIFIANEVWQNIDSTQINVLANKVWQLINSINAQYHIKQAIEMQIDCDWTKGTKENYFLFLKLIKNISQFKISSTIRLHQIKYFLNTGIPPVDKGLLMCYNMGNLKNYDTKNSILDIQELQKYINNLDKYPLKLDIALPLFNWKVLFRDKVYLGLVENLADSLLTEKSIQKINNRYQFIKDTSLAGYRFQKNDVLRNEQSQYPIILQAKHILLEKLKINKSDSLKIILFHLDDVILKKFSTNDLENIYNSM